MSSSIHSSIHSSFNRPFSEPQFPHLNTEDMCLLSDQYRASDTLRAHQSSFQLPSPRPSGSLAQSGWPRSSETGSCPRLSVGSVCGFYRHTEEGPAGHAGYEGLTRAPKTTHPQADSRQDHGGWTLHWDEPRGVQTPGDDGRGWGRGPGLAEQCPTV